MDPSDDKRLPALPQRRPALKYEQALDWIEAQARALLPDDRAALPPRQERLL